MRAHTNGGYMVKVLVTIPVTEEHKSWLEEAGQPAENGYRAEFTYINAEEANDDIVRGADIIFGNVSPALISKAKNLKLLQLFTAGADGYITAAPPDVAIANTSGAFGLAISEHMLAMLLALMKRMHQYRDNQLKRDWRDMGNVTSIENAYALVLGLGDIGGEFARKLKALGAYTVGVRRADTNKPEYMDEVHLFDEIDSLLPKADIVALALPGTAQTKRILDARRIAMLKRGAIVLNVGRGSAIDQDALCDALERGDILAGLDVTDPEPLPPSHRLWGMENALITPHVSGFFHLYETHCRMVKIAAENIRRHMAGLPYINIVSRETGYRADKYGGKI